MRDHTTYVSIVSSATTHGIIGLSRGPFVGEGNVIQGQSSANHAPHKRVDDGSTHKQTAALSDFAPVLKAVACFHPTLSALVGMGILSKSTLIDRLQ